MAASEFLNNAYMNNVCRIASGRLGRLLATQRASWDFSDEACRLSWVGRSALWLTSWMRTGAWVRSG